MINLYNEILYRPLFNLTVFLYNIIPGNDFGLAIIVLTILIKIVFLPLTVKTMLSQRALNKLNPKIKEIKDKYKKDQAAQSAAIMALYKENSINPLAGCLPMLVQLPILIALYKAFLAGFKPENLNILYSFVHNPVLINEYFLGLINISKSSHALVLLTGLLQFFQSKYTLSAQGTGNSEAEAMSRQMLYFFPIIIIIIGWNLPAGLLLYWITTTVLSVAEQAYIKHRHHE